MGTTQSVLGWVGNCVSVVCGFSAPLFQETMRTARGLFGWIGTGVSICAFCAPLVTVLIAIWNDGSAGDRSALPYFAGLFNCGVWLLYGFSDPGRRSFMICTNGVGAGSQLVCVVFFLIYYTAADRFLSLGYIVPGVLIYIALLGCFLTQNLNDHVLNYLCTVSGSIMAVAPLFNVDTVWRTMTIDSMPHVAVAGLCTLNAMVWTCYAFAGDTVDGFLAFANIVGVASGLCQLVMHGFFWWISLGQVAEGEMREWLLANVQPAAPDNDNHDE